MTVADTVCVPTAHLTWFGEEYITGSCQVCPVTDSEFSFSFCDEGDVIVGQDIITFPWVKNFRVYCKSTTSIRSSLRT